MTEIMLYGYKPPTTPNVSTGLGTPVLLTVGKEIGTGSEACVYRTPAYVLTRTSTRTRNINLAYKKYRESVMADKRYATQIAELYFHCKAAGLPVPATYRIAENERGKITGVLMTDLSNNGNIVVSVQDIAGPLRGVDEYSDPFDKATQQQRDAFAMVDFNKVKEELNRIAERATHAGLLIGSTDAYVLVISPQGDARIVVSDPASILYGKYREDGIFDIEVRGPTAPLNVYDLLDKTDRKMVADRKKRFAGGVHRVLELYQRGGKKALIADMKRLGKLGSYDFSTSHTHIVSSIISSS